MLYSVGEMDRKHLGILYPVIMVGMGVALAFISAAFSAGLPINADASTLRQAFAVSAQGNASYSGPDAFYQAATPTPAAQAVSHAGSTNGIVWLGLVIVAIVLLPILLRRSLWTK